MRNYFYMILAALLFASCAISDEMPLPTTGGGSTVQVDTTGYFSLTLMGDHATRAITTTISEAEKQEFLITIYKGGDVFRETTMLKNLNTSLPAGYGYTIKAESCSEYDAEHEPTQWGKRRYMGTSAPFGIQAGHTTPVNVGCSVANAAVEVVFDESVAAYFTTSYSVTIVEGDRTIVFDKDTPEGQIAYFNIGADGHRTVTYTIVAIGPKTITKTGTLELGKAKISRINLKYETGQFDFAIYVDEEDVFAETTVNISEDDITVDDGHTNMNSTHDGYAADPTEVDINDYGQN